MNILCHAGPWSDVYLKYVARGINSNAKCIIASAHKKVDETRMSKRYYDFLKSNRDKKYECSSEDLDIILRCRLLRELSRETALLHLNSMRDAIIEVYDQQRPDLVLSETIDAYVMDLMYFECQKRKIPFVGLVTVFTNGYVRVSARGEYNFVREPATDEVEQVLSMLEKSTYLPAFVGPAKVSPKKTVFFRWLRNIIKLPYFAFKRVVSGEPYNYHYWQALFVSWSWFHLWPRFTLGQSDWRDKLAVAGKPVIYLPLQFVPEATVDYWAQSVDVIDYEGVLVETIQRYQNDFHFLVKEHPNVLGYRSTSLYKKLERMLNVTICPTYFPSNDLVGLYEAVFVWTGTVGFESALRGKPVLMLAKPYYVQETDAGYLLIDRRTPASEIAGFLARKIEMTKPHKIEMVRHVLSGSVPGVLRVDGSWTENSETDIEQALCLGKNLSGYCMKLLEGTK